eukprot:Nk52_evm21s2402 gene=Nk52_evmTU21s2402
MKQTSVNEKKTPVQSGKRQGSSHSTSSVTAPSQKRQKASSHGPLQLKEKKNHDKNLFPGKGRGKGKKYWKAAAQKTGQLALTSSTLEEIAEQSGLNRKWKKKKEEMEKVDNRPEQGPMNAKYLQLTPSHFGLSKELPDPQTNTDAFLNECKVYVETFELDPQRREKYLKLYKFTEDAIASKTAVNLLGYDTDNDIEKDEEGEEEGVDVLAPKTAHTPTNKQNMQRPRRRGNGGIMTSVRSLSDQEKDKVVLLHEKAEEKEKTDRERVEALRNIAKKRSKGGNLGKEEERSSVIGEAGDISMLTSTEIKSLDPTTLKYFAQKGTLRTNITVPGPCSKGIERLFVRNELRADNALANVNLLRVMPMVLEDLVFRQKPAGRNPFAELLYYYLKVQLADTGFKCGWNNGGMKLQPEYALRLNRPSPTMDISFRLQFGASSALVLQDENLPYMSTGDSTNEGENYVYIQGVPLKYNPMDNPSRGAEPSSKKTWKKSDPGSIWVKYFPDESFEGENDDLQPPELNEQNPNEPLVFKALPGDPPTMRGEVREEKLFAVPTYGEKFPALGAVIGPISFVERYLPSKAKKVNSKFYLIQFWVDVSLSVVPNRHFEAEKMIFESDTEALKSKKEVITTSIVRYRISLARNEMIQNPKYVLPKGYVPEQGNVIFEWTLPMQNQTNVRTPTGAVKGIPPVSNLVKAMALRSTIHDQSSSMTPLAEASYYVFKNQYVVGNIGSLDQSQGLVKTFVPPMQDGQAINIQDYFLQGKKEAHTKTWNVSETRPRTNKTFLSAHKLSEQYLTNAGNIIFTNLHIKVRNVACDIKSGLGDKGLSEHEQEIFQQLRVGAPQIENLRKLFMDMNTNMEEVTTDYWLKILNDHEVQGNQGSGLNSQKGSVVDYYTQRVRDLEGDMEAKSVTGRLI